jgi:tRNA G18 (ribose-2'-O)-methylase SpoU
MSLVLDNIGLFLMSVPFRTSDAAGIGKVYLCGITATPPHPKLQKTALGSLETVEWEYAKDTLELVKKLKEEGHTIYSIELSEKAEDFEAVDYPSGVVLVIGNEIDGVNKEVMKISDKIVQIPMHGIKNSLNVASAYAIISYEATRKFRKLIR